MGTSGYPSPDREASDGVVRIGPPRIDRSAENGMMAALPAGEDPCECPDCSASLP